MKIAIILITWVMCAILTYVVIGYIDPDELEGDEVLTMWICLTLWAPMIVIGFGYFVVKLLSKFGDWLRGFLTGLIKKDGEKE